MERAQHGPAGQAAAGATGVKSDPPFPSSTEIRDRMSQGNLQRVGVDTTGSSHRYGEVRAGPAPQFWPRTSHVSHIVPTVHRTVHTMIMRHAGPLTEMSSFEEDMHIVVTAVKRMFLSVVVSCMRMPNTIPGIAERFLVRNQSLVRQTEMPSQANDA